MAKKIVKVQDKKETKKNLDLGSLATVVMENKDAVGKIVDGIGDIIDTQNKKNTKTTKKSSNKKSQKKSKSNLNDIMDLADKILK
ncbi:MAG: hypothetical protein IKE75_05890 [Bacilli bacterium]|nr:hypothetical protein [Bacilli bacterium]